MMVSKLITQVLILIIIAIIFGVFLNTFHIALWLGIALGITIQFGLYYGFMAILNAYITLKNKQLENERIKEFSHQGLEVTCPCHLRKTEFVPIVLNTNNTYKCDTCQKNISVYIVPETAMITETIASTVEALDLPLPPAVIEE